MLKQQSERKRSKKESPNGFLSKGILLAVVVVAIAGIAWAKFSGNNGADEEDSLFTVRRGDLRISFFEPGKVQANKSATLSSEVDGECTIISIVPEGSRVNEGDVLVELDSAAHRDEIDKHEVLVKSAEAAYITALEAYEIQKGQNESDVKAAELARDFAEIDLRKYVGEAAFAEAREAYQSKTPNGGEGGGPGLSFAELKPEDYTGGDWYLQIMKAENAIMVARTALKLAESRLKGTEELTGKGYATETELETDRLSYLTAKIAVEQAEEAKGLLINYEHPKQLAKFISADEEAQRKLERAKRKAIAQLAQKDADLNASKAAYNIEKSRLDHHKDQLSKTIIKAPQSGLVTYSSSEDEPWHGRGHLIAQGEKVWEHQDIIELPDVSTMKVKVHIQESLREMLKPGQPAIVRVEALPGLTFRGHLEKVDLLPDQGHRWLDPDLTVYISFITIDDDPGALMPGMTAMAEIILAELTDVLYVPVEAVTVRGGKELCFVVNGRKKTLRAVEVGLSNDNYVEIKSGLNEGDQVLARAADASATGTERRSRKNMESANQSL